MKGRFANTSATPPSTYSTPGPAEKHFREIHMKGPWCDARSLEQFLPEIRQGWTVCKLMRRFPIINADGGTGLIPIGIWSDEGGAYQKRRLSYRDLEEYEDIEVRFAVPSWWARKILDALRLGGDRILRSAGTKEIYVADKTKKNLYKW